MPGVPRDVLAHLPTPPGGWPDWVDEAPYVGSRHPGAGNDLSPADGANCQHYAYALLALQGLRVPLHRSSELWADPSLEHPDPARPRDLDLGLWSRDGAAYGAHVGVHVGGQVVHLCAEVGRPAVWTAEEMARRERYQVLVGLVRVPR